MSSGDDLRRRILAEHGCERRAVELEAYLAPPYGVVGGGRRGFTACS